MLWSRSTSPCSVSTRDMWVLGGYEQARKKGFLVRVDRWDAATLLPIIQQWVAPGLTVWTDEPHPPLRGPKHGCDDNRVEAMWSRAKDKFKAGRRPTNRDMVAVYLAEFSSHSQRWYKQHRKQTFTLDWS